MSRVIEATYQGGALRPREPLDIAEGTSVKLKLVEPAAIPGWDATAARAAAARVMAVPPVRPADRQPVGREHDRYLYGDLSEFAGDRPR